MTLTVLDTLPDALHRSWQDRSRSALFEEGSSIGVRTRAINPVQAVEVA
jgi:hypothetical protein